MAAPVQGGIGIFHIMIQATLLLYGLTKESGMAFALIVLALTRVGFLSGTSGPPMFIIADLLGNQGTEARYLVPCCLPWER